MLTLLWTTLALASPDLEFAAQARLSEPAREYRADELGGHGPPPVGLDAGVVLGRPGARWRLRAGLGAELLHRTWTELDSSVDWRSETSWRLEPRASARWGPAPAFSLDLGVGLAVAHLGQGGTPVSPAVSVRPALHLGGGAVQGLVALEARWGMISTFTAPLCDMPLTPTEQYVCEGWTLDAGGTSVGLLAGASWR
jgi:hypothetical protein